MPKRNNGLTFEERFWSGVDKRGPDECWPWTRSRYPLGYGTIGVSAGDAGQDKSHNVQTHRVAFYLTHGYYPTIARHTCDNPPCCNPAHIQDGTVLDNVVDMMKRGRHNGWNAPPKLTPDQVRTIRALQGVESQKSIASRYGVDQTVIGKIHRRETYKWVDEE